MSFRMADLKKSVRKGSDGYYITPTRLEGRQPAFRIDFLLQQFEGHLGCPRRLLDPDSLLDFMGDARLGRGLLATLSQWYRMRPRTFPEVLEDGGARLRQEGVSCPMELRARLYAAVNSQGMGYLDPTQAPLFWQRQSRSLGLRREALGRLMRLDRPEEAVLVRTGPRPTAADVMAAYNARAHTTLLRSAAEIAIRCRSSAQVIEQFAREWADPLGVSWSVDGSALSLRNRADALGCWTRHGRRVERVALEFMALPEVNPIELSGRLEHGGRNCRFRWKEEVLPTLGARGALDLAGAPPQEIASLASSLRRERDRSEASDWRIRLASHALGAEDGILLPHLELRRGDWSLYLRLVRPLSEDASVKALAPFQGKTSVALAPWSGDENDPIILQFADGKIIIGKPGALLTPLAEQVEALRAAAASSPAAPRSPSRRAA